MSELRLQNSMRAWSAGLDLEQLAQRVEELRQRLADREQLLETLQENLARCREAERRAELEAVAGELAVEVGQLKEQFERVAAVLAWEQARRVREGNRFVDR